MATAAGGMKYKQDMPPPGGYQQILWQRTFPKTWVNARRLAFIGFGVWFYGLYNYRAWKKFNNRFYLEEVDVKCAYEPFVFAERDRNWLKLMRRNREMEEEVMKDVPGWKVGTWYGEPVFFTTADGWWDVDTHEVYVHARNNAWERDLWFDHHSEYAGPKWYDKYLPQWAKDCIW